MDLDINLKKASLLSDKVFALHDLEGIKKRDLPAPPDKFYLATLIAFFSGMVGVLPITFFLNANDYWMYKFRDPQFETYDLNNKTTFQTMFVSANSVVTSIPSIISIFLTGIFAHRLDMRVRLLVPLGCTSLLFILSTFLVKVDTDSWQTLFFISSLAIIGTTTFFLPFFGMSNTAFLSRFPFVYMKMNMFGTAVGGLFGSTLQIISLTIGNNSQDVALIYFSSGTAVIMFTFVLIYLMHYSPVVQFYWTGAQDEKRPTHTFREYKETALSIWPIIVIMLLMILTMGTGHPNITNLIVSEGYTGKNENLWYDKYFVVTATYFAFDFFQLVGRFFATPIITKTNYPWCMALAAVRCFGLAPLFVFCNAQPRTLPVWFPHDYQYMIIMAVFSITMSVLMGATMLSIANFAGERTEIAYMMAPAIMILCTTVTSPLNPFFVKILT